MDAHGWSRGLKDVGEHALMRGLSTAFPIVRLGLVPILRRASARRPAIKHLTGIPCRGPAPAYEREGCRSYERRIQASLPSLATDHMKPTSSRATAVQTTVVFLPLAIKAR
jgi:hypothetical protein